MSERTPYLQRFSVLIPAAIAVAALTFAVYEWRSSAESSVDRSDDSVWIEEGFWDSSGQRKGLPLVDEHSPWADLAGFNLLAERPNSIAGGVKDSRKFLGAVVNGSDRNWSRVVDVKPGDTITVYALIENHADYELLYDAPDDRGVARGTRIALAYGEWSEGSATVFALVSAQNTDPAWIASSVDVRSGEPITLQPIPGSARQVVADNETALPDPGIFRFAKPSDSSGLAGEGALIGTSGPTGEFAMLPAGVVNVLAEFLVVG